MSKQKKLRIVGIGASAGGLEAIYEFFENMPNDSGLSFVVIQHLSPDFKSLMDELLTKHTRMPVSVIKGNTTPKPNHIYLIPSKKNVTIEDGVIKPIDRFPSSVINLPIDVFFQALGKDLKENAIGVILSGSGTDGSRGMRTIKEAGGLTMVQDPETAQFRSMPEAAISVGLADSVLPPFALAKELARISQTSLKNKITIIDTTQDENESYLNKILSRITELSGVDFKEYRKGTLIRRTEKRMFINNFYDLEDYYYFLLDNEEEGQILFKEFLIGVTRFFRDKTAFDLLKDKVIPEIVNSKPVNVPIRIWVPGCSTGEEAYSIAMLFIEYLSEHKLNKGFKIFASDIDKEAIAFASAGIYHNHIVADVSNERLSKYFSSEQNVFTVRKVVREKIVFAHHDALKDPPFIHMDLISCRNMLIYLNTKVQQNLLANFQFALNYEGFLMLGPSESIGTLKPAFQVLNSKWNIFQNISKQKVGDIFHKKHREKKRSDVYYADKNQSDYDTNLLYKDLEMTFPTMLAERYAPLALFVNEQFDIRYINGDFGPILYLPNRFAKFNLLEMIGDNDPLIFKNGLRKVQETNQPNKYTNMFLKKGNKTLNLDIVFEQQKGSDFNESLYLILFYLKGEVKENEKMEVVKVDSYLEERLQTMEKELREAKRQKQNLVEQLETTNEELQSSNEELLAANEELQSTNEELQSVNEELYTVNTELQSKIEELITVNSDMNNLLKSTDIGTIFLDMGLRIRKFTPALRDQFNLIESDIGRPITNFTNAFNDTQIYQDIRDVLKTLNTHEREIINRDGVHFLMRILPYRTDDNRVDGVVLTFTNIEELHKATSKLKLSGSLYRAVFNNTIEHITLVTPDLNIEDVNFLPPGYTRNAVLGGHVNRLWPSYKEGKIKQIIHEIANKKQRSGAYETKILLATGEIRWYQNLIVPVFNGGNKPHHFVMVTRDMTIYKEQENQFQALSLNMEIELEKRAGELLQENKRLHELNGYYDSLLEGAVDDIKPVLKRMIQASSDEKDNVEISKNDIANLQKIMDTLEDVSSYQKDASKLIREIDIKEVFLDLRKSLKNRIDTAEANIRYQFGQHKNILYIPAYFRHILHTLLDNALQYKNPDQALEIQVSTEEKDGFLVLTVKDNGIGMDLKRYGHFLFRPFKRLTLDGNGMGINLSIANNLVRKNGGYIQVKSFLGEGAEFRVYLRAYKEIETKEVDAEQMLHLRGENGHSYVKTK